MAFTRHGFHIPGTTMADKPESVARCGGPKICEECANDVGFIEETGLYRRIPTSNDDVTIKILLEYFVRDLKQLNQTRTYVPIEDVVKRLDRIIHN